ncbi:MAG: MBL fold metallo-hydrolase [Lentisphaerae bacterium]|nr:MBL fold metallo-hydrolase [Lentisphaerota bacterium]
MQQTTRTGTVPEDLAAPSPGGVRLWWLGQAGFAVRAGGLRLLIDPYLSDALEAKYRGREFSHARLMPPPLEPRQVRELDGFLCTHAHSDHMDPGTIGVVAACNPGCRFVAPRAERQTAIERGVPPDRFVGMNAGDTLTLGPDVELQAIAAAHEEFETNDAGEHRFLGYIVRAGGITLYHAGDCVPYPGQTEALVAAQVHVALLPVNGRGNGVSGNFTFDEAVALCRAAQIPVLLVHHFGMFAFNTVPVVELRRRAAGIETGTQVIVPEVGVRYEARRRP